MTTGWVTEQIRFRPGPWWAWKRDDRGDYVQAGETLPCGHVITATSRRSDAQLWENFRRMKARHVGHVQ